LGIWKLVVEYEGTEFAGWQVQPELRTVQGELGRALSTVLRREVAVQGAGRTDAGVHACGQVASIEAAEDVNEVLAKVNGVLPRDVVVRHASPAPPGFHARHSAVRRHYRYRLHRGVVAVERRTCLSLPCAPDLERIRLAADRLPASRDFAALASAVDPGESTICRLESVEIVEEGSFVNVEVVANRFLRKMVRTIVGTLLEVGRGRRSPDWIDEVLDSGDRRAAGPVVPARGLFLMAVDYPGDPGLKEKTE
jgi:tRNA pseudouridine38-40 synthase